MTADDLQRLCAQGQESLERMDYFAAEAALVDAESIAFQLRDFDTLSRLYMPLQEARRQIRQRCGEGTVNLGLLANNPTDAFDPQSILNDFPQGQLLIAGWGTFEPALRLREIAHKQRLFVETFLGAVYPIEAGHAVVIAPLADVALPEPAPMSIDRLIAHLPAHCVVLSENELPKGSRAGSAQTYAEVMDLWERLHAPFLALADATADPMQQIEAYRKTIRVDYACELAHQKLSFTAREVARRRTA